MKMIGSLIGELFKELPESTTIIACIHQINSLVSANKLFMNNFYYVSVGAVVDRFDGVN